MLRQTDSNIYMYESGASQNIFIKLLNTNILTHMEIYLNIATITYTCTSIRTHTHTYSHADTYIWACEHACMCVCIRVSVCVCVYSICTFVVFLSAYTETLGVKT